MGAAKDPKMTPDAKAAHELLTELRTRVSIQPLPYQDGDESNALESLVAIFDHAREAIKKNPGCAEFARLTADMLNGDLRRVTAKWHPRSIAGELKTRDGAADFRSDLADLRLRLRGFANTLHNMAYGSDFSDIETPPAIDQAELDKIFADLPFGIPEKHLIDDTIRVKINESEASEIAARREKPAETLSNGVGLALSGGGIRSASFCLGACQALADRGMLEHVDVLSTVSGGGYAGAFVAGQMAARPADPTFALKKRNGPDSDEIRGLRAKVKYLAPSGVADKWSMICSIVAGMVLNWTAPAAIICLLVLAAVFTQNMSVAALPHLRLIA